jgi:hypothetical protein
MNKKDNNFKVIDDHLGCFGDFSMIDPVCKKLCALKLRCAIETDQNDQMEFWEDIMYSDDLFVRMQ